MALPRLLGTYSAASGESRAVRTSPSLDNRFPGSLCTALKRTCSHICGAIKTHRSYTASMHTINTNDRAVKCASVRHFSASRAAASRFDADTSHDETAEQLSVIGVTHASGEKKMTLNHDEQLLERIPPQRCGQHAQLYSCLFRTGF